MLIDWFTVVAQLINFVILLVALKFLLYDRIVEAMDARQERIRSKEAQAESRADEAEQEARRLEEQRRELDEQRDRLLEEAKARAETRERELVEEARERAEAQERRWRESLARDQKELTRELVGRVASEAVEVSRRALRDLADSEIEERMTRAFLGRLDELDEDERSALGDDGALVVRTGFDLADGLRREIRDTLHEVVGKSLDIEWEVHRDQPAGIAVRSGSRTVGWGFSEYLDDLESRFEELLAEASTDGSGDGDRDGGAGR